MIDHKFRSLTHWRIGPIRNQWGWVFSAAEIGDTWFLKWTTPIGETGITILSDHDSVVDEIDRINRESGGNFTQDD